MLRLEDCHQDDFEVALMESGSLLVHVSLLCKMQNCHVKMDKCGGGFYPWRNDDVMAAVADPFLVSLSQPR